MFLTSTQVSTQPRRCPVLEGCLPGWQSVSGLPGGRDGTLLSEKTCLLWFQGEGPAALKAAGLSPSLRHSQASREAGGLQAGDPQGTLASLRLSSLWRASAAAASLGSHTEPAPSSIGSLLPRGREGQVDPRGKFKTLGSSAGPPRMESEGDIRAPDLPAEASSATCYRRSCASKAAAPVRSVT